MKGNRTYMDIGSILDEVFDAAKDFGQKMTEEFETTGGPDAREHLHHGWYDSSKDENPDYYPSYSYPPMKPLMPSACPWSRRTLLGGSPL